MSSLMARCLFLRSKLKFPLAHPTSSPVHPHLLPLHDDEGSIHQEDVIVLSVPAPGDRASDTRGNGQS